MTMTRDMGGRGVWGRMAKRLWCALLAAASLLAVSGCIFDTVPVFEGEKVAGGGGIETVGIRGYAFDEGGKPVAGAKVLLRTRGFLADSGIVGLQKKLAVISGETETDASGLYAIDSVEPGDYRIEVGDPATQGAVIEATVVPETRVQQVDPAILRARGAVAGHLVQAGYYVSGAWVHIYGMQRSLTTDSYGRISFGDLPEGDYSLVIRRPRPYGHVVNLTLPVIRVEAGKTNDLGNLELPGGCPDYHCDSLVVRYILDQNRQDSVSVDSVALRATGTGRIEELDLSRLGVTVLPYIYDLLGLKRLELENNGLTTLPIEATRIVTLEYLSLNNNRIRTLPSQIGNMKFLVWLHLYNNYIDSLPPAIGSLTSLRYFTASSNYLQGLPAEMGRLGNLTQLFLSHNALADLPESILSIPKLSVIEVHGNRLCGLGAKWQAYLDKATAYDWRAYQTCP